MSYLEEYTTKLVCPSCGGVQWKCLGDRVLLSIPPIEVHDYECAKCGTKRTVKSNPFHAPVSREVILEIGDEVL